MIASHLYRRSRRCPAATCLAIIIAGCAGIAMTPVQAASGEKSTGLPYPLPVREAAQRFDIPESWIRAVMHAESGGNPRAVSVAGAMGIMQIMPATWAALTAHYGLGSDPFDVRANILAGAAYLRAMLDRYGDLAAALAAYNAGPARVDAWHAGNRPLPAETVAYVTRIAPSSIANGGVSSVSSVPLPRDWHTASLFTSHSGSGDTTSTDGRSDGDHGASPASTDIIPTASRPSAGTLFVPPMAQGS